MKKCLFKAKKDNKEEYVYCFCNVITDEEGGCELKDAEPLDSMRDKNICSIAEVDENTLCQDTSLCDKNGTPIFEGDIIEFDGNYPSATVTWNTFVDKFYAENRYFSYALSDTITNCITVIGNTKGVETWAVS